MFTGSVQRIYPKTRQMEKMPRAGFQERGYGASLSLKPRHAHSALVFTNSGALQISLFKRFYNPPPAVLPSQKVRLGGWGFRTLITQCLIFLVTSSHPRALWRPSLSHFITVNSGMVTRGQLKKTKTFPSLRKFLGLQELCSRNWRQKIKYIFKIIRQFLLCFNIKKFFFLIVVFML